MTGSAEAVAAAIRDRQSFVLTSHARPDGDAVGSSLALAFALDQLGKTVRVVLRDPPPSPYQTFPGIARIERTDRLSGPADVVVLLECSDLGRPEVAGLDQYPTINIDHHLGNEMYATVNWFDADAAACGELVADVIDALGVRWTPEIGAHLYLALATDTGSFRYGPITARTFEICRRIAAAGVDTPQLSRQIFDSFSIGRVKLTGALITAMELHCGGRFATLELDDDLLERCGATPDDTEGLVNLPLAAHEVVAVALFKRQVGDTFRISLRSKGAVDVRSVAAHWQGGGHLNAAGCTLVGQLSEIKDAVVREMARALAGAGS